MLQPDRPCPGSGEPRSSLSFFALLVQQYEYCQDSGEPLSSGSIFASLVQQYEY
jgi:hypothetical protein